MADNEVGHSPAQLFTTILAFWQIDHRFDTQVLFCSHPGFLRVSINGQKITRFMAHATEGDAGSNVAPLAIPLHVSYIQKLGEVRVDCQVFSDGRVIDTSRQSQDDLMYHLTSHLRLNAVYWGLTALCVMKHKDALDREQLIEFVTSCWDDKAGTSCHEKSFEGYQRALRYTHSVTLLKGHSGPIRDTMHTSFQPSVASKSSSCTMRLTGWTKNASSPSSSLCAHRLARSLGTDSARQTRDLLTVLCRLFLSLVR